MKSCAKCGASGTALTLERVAMHEDIVLGSKVRLVNAVDRITCSCEHSVVLVPNQEGLIAAVALCRVQEHYKLSSTEIRLLRLAMQLKAVDLAKELDVTPETLSRWENGDTIGNTAEKCLRMTVALALMPKAIAIDVDLRALMSMEITPVRPNPAPILYLERVLVKVDHRKDRSWDTSEREAA